MAKSEVQEGGNEWDKDIDDHKLFMIENRVVGYLYIFLYIFMEMLRRLWFMRSYPPNSCGRPDL